LEHRGDLRGRELPIGLRGHVEAIFIQPIWSADELKVLHVKGLLKKAANSPIHNRITSARLKAVSGRSQCPGGVNFD
jgi:hypothetical protein